MTYQDQLDKLFQAYVSRTNAYIETAWNSGYASAEAAQLKQALRVTEREYLFCLDLVKSKKVLAGDPFIPNELNRELRMQH